MFAVASYITPLLMGYLDKYVELRQEDFKINFWEGDATLRQVKLRTDFFEKLLQIPVILKSGQVNELKIYVPWHKIVSEPIVVTLKTVECVLKVRDTAYDDASSQDSSELDKKTAISKQKPKLKRQDTESDQPPNYMQGMISRILNNITLVINNLIIKFVEDDIVLSVNVMSAECFPVNSDWNRAFVDFDATDLSSRKVLKFCDLTICMDRADASGNIELYEQPLIFKCVVACRILLVYDSIKAKLPKLTRFNLFCEELKATMSDNQLPIFIRLIELCIALYNGVLNIPPAGEKKSGDEKQDLIRTVEDSAVPADTTETQGWGAWALSFVIAEEEEEEEEESDSGSRVEVKPVTPLISLGFYVKKATIQFQLSEKRKDTQKPKARNRVFQPFLLIEIEGVTAEILVHGVKFFDAQCGITWLNFQTLGPCICSDASEENATTLISGGEKLEDKTIMNFITDSLFDDHSKDDEDRSKSFPVDQVSHFAEYTEDYGIQRFGAFWFDYFYSWEKEEGKGRSGSRSSLSDSNEPLFQKENAVMRFVLGGTYVNFNSSFLHRLMKIIQCATNHQYEPYEISQPVEREENTELLKECDIQSLEEFIPTRSFHLTLVHPMLVAVVPEHEKWAPSKRTPKTTKKSKDGKLKDETHPLPAVCVSATRVELKMTKPMYPAKLVSLTSKIAGPSENLLRHCHTHQNIQFVELHAGLQKIEADGTKSHLHTVISPCDPLIKFSHLVLPKSWQSSTVCHSEMKLELYQMSVSLTKASILLLTQLASDWITMKPVHTQYQENSLLNDVFTQQTESDFIPVLDVSVSGLELKYYQTSLVKCYSVNLSSVQLILYTKDSSGTRVMPVLYGPSDTKNLENYQTLLQPVLQPDDIETDLIRFTLQIPNDTDFSQAPAVLLFGMEGLMIYIDSGLKSWFEYTPKLTPSVAKTTEVSVDIALAQAASPLQNISQVSVHSSSSLTQPTSSRPLTQSQSHLMSPSNLSAVMETSENRNQTSFCSKWFPLFRKLNVQVKVKSSCVYLSNAILHLPDPNMDISMNMRTALADGILPHLLVVYLPEISIHSYDLKPLSFHQTVPINLLGGSLIGDKLPWNVQISKFTIYSIHDNTHGLAILKHFDVKSTVAVSCKYVSPTSQKISTLGLCLHIDVQPSTVSVSHKQILLINSVVENIIKLVMSSTQLIMGCFSRLHVNKSAPETEIVQGSHAKKVESGVSCDDNPAAEASEETSQNDSYLQEPVTAESSDSDVKLTLWTQLLVPKMVFQLYSKIDSLSECCVETVLEDLAVSVDVQQVYSKVKITLHSLNISHSQKRNEETKWSSGSCEGIILSCLGELSRDVNIVANKFNSDSLVSHDALQRDKTRGFLSVTMTRALCENNNKRLKKQGVEVPGLIEMDSAPGQCELYFHKYITEFCVNLEPCDIVLFPPVVKTVLDTFRLDRSPQRDTGSVTLKSTSLSKRKNEEKLTRFAAHVFPLLHVNMSNVRIFLPKQDVILPESVSAPAALNIQSTLDHDLFVVQFNSVSVNPQADNPLPRYPVRKDMYDWAVLNGLTQHAGACIEDRQYQIDVKGLTMCTGNWVDFVKSIRSNEENATPSIQMPALEWNTVLSLQEKDKDDIKLVPMAIPFNLKVVVVPAIVYQKLNSHPRNDQTLVCGFSVEVNVTSDLDLYISTNQVQLMNTLLTNSLHIIQSGASAGKTWSDSDRLCLQEPLLDSGVESDVSTVLNDQAHFLNQPQPASSSVASETEQQSKVMPFELLLTADRISCTLYSHKRLEKHFHPAKVKEEKKTTTNPKSTYNREFDWKRDNFGNLPSNGKGDDEMGGGILHPSDSSTNFNFLRVHHDSGGRSHDIEAGTVCIKPFLYAFIAQPHTVLACGVSSQKFEMSCYNIIIKGCDNQLHIPVSEKQLIPDGADFSLYWVETRPGQPSIKTGIPPSLFTVQIKDFLQEPACVMLRLERPIKGNLDFQKILQIQEFLGEITLSTVSFNEGNRSERHLRDSSDVSTPYILSKIDHIEVVTDQIVVAMETVPKSGEASCVFSTSCIRVESEFQHDHKGKIEMVTARFHVKDVLLTTIFSSRCLPLLGPTSIFLETIFHWTRHSGNPTIPKTLIAVETDLITINFGQEHFLCLAAILKNVNNFLCQQQSADSRSLEKVKLEKGEDVDSFQFVADVSQDDFKSGGLTYISAPDGSDIHPGSGEVVLTTSKAVSATGSMMTWCYHQSRVLQRLVVHPVPFNTTEDITQQVACVLQYWDTATRQFIDYINFGLSESETCNIELPAVNPRNSTDLISSQMWRIILNVVSTDTLAGVKEAVLLPTSLLGCIRLDSCFIPSLVPVCQLCVILTAVDVHLFNHLQYTNTDVPNKLKPFYLSQSEVNEEEFAVIRVDGFTATAGHVEGKQRRTTVEMRCDLNVDVVEFENLTRVPVIQANSLTVDLNYLHNEEPRVCEVNSKGENIVVQLGKGTIHTLNSSLQTWNQVLQNEAMKTTAIFTHYVICNDTQQTLHIGQVGTSEDLMMLSRQMLQYSWLSHSKQKLHVSVDGGTAPWSEPFDLVKTGTVVRVVKTEKQNYTLLIRIKPLSNTIKQITISGQLVICSRLTQDLDVKLVTNRNNHVTESSSVIGGGERMASYVVEHEDVREIKLRLSSIKSAWSQEIHVNGDKMKKNRLIKIPLTDRSSYIHVWCTIYCQHFTNSAVQNLVLLTPLYVLRSQLPHTLYVEMTSAKLKEEQTLEVAGCGREYQLYCVGGDISHSLAFKLGMEMEKSNPPLVLSTGSIDQIEQTSVDNVDIEEVCSMVNSDLSIDWPYCFNNSVSTDYSSLRETTISSTTPCKMEGNDIIQPSVELEIHLSEYMTGCKTLLVDIAPKTLLTNFSSIDLLLLANQQTWPLGNGCTFTVPKLKNGEFELGYLYGAEIIKTAPIPVSSEESSSKLYSTDIGRVLFTDGIVHTTVVIPGIPNKVLFLTLKSQIKHNMRVVSVREKFCFTNLTDIPLSAQLISLPLGSSQVSIQEETSSQVNIPSHNNCTDKTDGNIHPLLFWCQYSTHELLTGKNNYTQYIHYICLKQNPPSKHDSTSPDLNSQQWSLPVRITATADGNRHTLSIPNNDSTELSTLPYCLTAQVKDGITHLVLMEDHSPICKIINSCSYPLVYGQTLMNISLSGITVQEEAELIDNLPVIQPGGSTYYTMPYLNTNYPLTDGVKYPKIHFCALVSQGQAEDKGCERSPWSQGVDLTTGSIFIKLPQVADVKVSVEKKASILLVELQPVGKAEISAKEIRSRLKDGHSATVTIAAATTSEPIKDESQKTADFKPVIKSKSSSVDNVTNFLIGCSVVKFSFILLDETSSVDAIGEVIRLTAEDLFLGTYPVAAHDRKLCVVVCIGGLHLDNQLYGLGQFDFPVILLPQDKKKSNVNVSDVESVSSVMERHAVIKSTSFVHVQVVMTTDCLNNSVIDFFDFTMKPVSVYIDDMFVYHMLKEIELLLPNNLPTVSPQPITWRRLHPDVRETASSFSQPIRIQHLSIQPIKMLLSVHASLKLFLAADHTPLSFGGFERRDLSTTKYQLIRVLAMHYASAAIFRAGIVIGSLEILGNPTGLVRSVGIGISDLFRLPYAGLTRGPGAFVSGVSNGMGSLLRNVSAGMITSVTNLASSVSRNMDRLSLDSTHVERQEENRRNRPLGVSDGLVQGLTGFGISLLGAVAGLADQPLQTVISQSGSVGDRRSSTSSVASGLVTGVGKGIIGIVTKPIGGAAELVSQTGQGILHGTGLGQLPERLETPIVQSRSSYTNAVIKYPLKLLNSLPIRSCLMTLDAYHLDVTGGEILVTLILTSDVLFVVNNKEDTQQQAFSIQELDVCEKIDDPTLISLVWTDNSNRSSLEANNSNKDRVAAFISSAPTFGPLSVEDTPVTDSQSDGTSSTILMAPQYDFHVGEEYRSVFISLFKLVKNMLLAKGFPILK